MIKIVPPAMPLPVPSVSSAQLRVQEMIESLHPQMASPIWREQEEETQRALAAIRERNQRHDLAVELAIANTAEEFYVRLIRRIVEFEKGLDETKEVGLRLVSFGQAITLHVRDLTYHNPSLIIFQGLTENGDTMELIQHVTQISFLLMAVKRLEPDQDRCSFGFHAAYEQFFGQKPA